MSELRLNAIRLNTLSLNTMAINHIGFKKKASSSASGDVDENGYIIFADPEVARICAENWGDGIGITKEQAASVTHFNAEFANNELIESFNELEKFTSLNTIGYTYGNGVYGVGNCPNIKSIKFPASLRVIGMRSFQNTPNLVNIKGLEYV
jgi:hypothetical protein